MQLMSGKEIVCIHLTKFALHTWQFSVCFEYIFKQLVSTYTSWCLPTVSLAWCHYTHYNPVIMHYFMPVAKFALKLYWIEGVYLNLTPIINIKINFSMLVLFIDTHTHTRYRCSYRCILSVTLEQTSYPCLSKWRSIKNCSALRRTSASDQQLNPRPHMSQSSLMLMLRRAYWITDCNNSSNGSGSSSSRNASSSISRNVNVSSSSDASSDEEGDGTWHSWLGLCWW